MRGLRGLAVYFRDNMFMISCPARSGSTMLVHLLRSHPDVWCNGEVFGKARLTGLLGFYAKRSRENPKFLSDLTQQRDKAPAKFLYKYVLDTQDKRVVGFKFKTDEMTSTEYKTIKDLVVGEKDLKIIYLHRENLLNRYVSYIIAQKTGITLLREDEEKPVIGTFRLDPKECVRDFKIVLQRRESVKDMFKEHRSIEVDYDMLVKGEQSYTDKLCEFLEVRKHPITTPTAKIIDRDISSIVENYDEIVEYFEGSEFEQCLGA